MAPAIGIDLGTSYSCVGISKPEGVEIIADCRTIPSYVAFTETERLIGGAAKNQVARNPRNTVFDVKRLIGRKFNDPSVQEDMRRWPFTVKADSNGKAVIEVEVKGKKKIFHPEEISAMILGKLKEIAEAHIGQEVSEAVITVPAYFNQAQRQATKVAGRIAGFNGIDLINEPSAAALAYAHNKKGGDGERHVLIFDLGGGSLDVSLMTILGDIVKVKATAGDTHLKSEDFDNRLVDHCVQDFKERHNVDLCTNARCINAQALRRLKTACEMAKRTLSSETQASIDIDGLFNNKHYSITITRDRFEELCEDYFSKILRPIEQVLKDSDINKSQVEEILLVGGSTRIPKVQKLIKEFFDGKEPCHSINSDEAVAYGAAIEAVKLIDADPATDKKDPPLDKIPLSLGVQVVGGVFSKLIERGTTLPVKRSGPFTTVSDDQTTILVEVLEGEGQMAADNNLLGKFRLRGILPAPSDVPKLEITFDVDVNGILYVSARDKATGKSSSITITQANRSLSRKEIDRLFDEAEKVQASDEANRLEARNNLESYICQTKSSLIKMCEEVQSWLDSKPLADKAAYDAKQKEVEDIFNSILTKTYQEVTTSEGGTGESDTDV